MEYYDEELLEERRKQERAGFTTLETGLYAGEELIRFSDTRLPDTDIHLLLPEHFVIMPDSVKTVKYPSRYAPDFVLTSLDTLVNFVFNCLEMEADGTAEALGLQFQTALKNMNPSIAIKNKSSVKTLHGYEMSWFEYRGFLLDGQSYNRVFLIKMKSAVIHSTFSCPMKDKDHWIPIIDKIYMEIREEDSRGRS